MSTNERAERVMGYRVDGRPIGIILSTPAEQGFHCPVHPEETAAIDNDVLHWSEYRAFLWCALCDRDYPSALCCADLDQATEMFLNSVEEVRRDAQSQCHSDRVTESQLQSGNTVVLQQGDTVSIPETGDRVVGHIQHVRKGRYQLRLDRKFEPSITVDVLQGR